MSVLYRMLNGTGRGFVHTITPCLPPPPPPHICGPIVPSLRTKVENKNMHPPKKNCVVCIPFSFLSPISLFTISELLHAALSRLHFHGCPLHLANVHTLQPISFRNGIRCSRRPSILQTIYTEKKLYYSPSPSPLRSNLQSCCGRNLQLLLWLVHF